MIECKFLFFVLLTAAVSLPTSSLMAETVPFLPGEKIYYSVKQLGVKAGDAVLQFKGEAYLEGKKYSLIVFTAKGFNFFDEERIYVDPESFQPVRVLRDLNIFGNKENIMEEYFLKDGLIRITKTAGGKTTVQDISKKGAVDNIYGFLYRTRLRENIQVGKFFDLNLTTLNVKMEGVSEVNFKAAGKSYRSVLFRSVPAKYTIWFDQGPEKLPLRIVGSLGLSNTVMVMTGYEAQ